MRVLVLACLLMLLAGPVVAKPLEAGQCAPRDVMVQRLNVSREQMRVAFGLDSRGVVMELYLSEAGQRWTLIATSAENQSCIIGMGEAWKGEAARRTGPAA